MENKSLEEKRHKNSVVVWVLCFVLFPMLTAGLFAPELIDEFAGDAVDTFPDSEQHISSENKEIVLLGDSILGQIQGVDSVEAHLRELTGMSVYSAALGGTNMSRLNAEGRPDYTKDILSMEALATAIATGDFGAQQTVRIRESGTEHFADTIDSLEGIDFDNVQILFVGHGINDYHAGVSIGNPGNPEDAYTFSGALRRSITTLQKAYPDLRIILVTPTYSWYPSAEHTCEEQDFGGGILEAYVQAELTIAEELGIEVLDVYHDYYPHEAFEDWMQYTSDGVHPNEAGRRMLAETLADYVNR